MTTLAIANAYRYTIINCKQYGHTATALIVIVNLIVVILLYTNKLQVL